MEIVAFLVGLACLFFWMSAFSKYQKVEGGLKVWGLNLFICLTICYFLMSGTTSSSHGYDGWGNGVAYLFTFALNLVILLVWGMIINAMAKSKVAATKRTLEDDTKK